MSDIELETLKNYARIIKAFCINKEECKNCPFGKDTEGRGYWYCQLSEPESDIIPCNWEV